MNRSRARLSVVLMAALAVALLLGGGAGAKAGARAEIVGANATLAADPAPARAYGAGPDSARREAPRFLPQRRRMNFDFKFAVLGLVLVVAALGLAIRAPRGETHAPRARRRRTRAGIVCLGLLSFASYYQFFLLHHPGGFNAGDTLHYYIGSKYTAELGYFGLYEAILVAASEDHLVEDEAFGRVRDLRTLRVFPHSEMLERGRRWKRRFRPERWQAFKHDVGWFHARMAAGHLPRLMRDHGYHPAPVWSLIGGALASAIPVESPLFTLLVRADRVLVFASFAAIAWGFGWEAAGLCAAAWGSGYLWRYGWGGDSFLRQIWFASLMFGLCLARRGRSGLAGAALSLSALLRIFPGIFLAGYAARALRETWQRRQLPRRAVRLLGGALLAGSLLVAASSTISPEGFGLYAEFADKIASFAKEPSTNKMGLQVLLSAVEAAGPRVSIEGTRVTRPAPWARAGLRVVRYAALAFFLFLYWRALPRVEGWEAAAMSFALIPILSEPTNYYFSFALVGILLGTRRRRITLYVLSACALWTLNGLIFYVDPVEFLGASAIALLLSYAVLREMARPPDRSWLPDAIAITTPKESL